MVKLGNTSDFESKKEVDFCPGHTIVINSLPFGFHDKMMALFPDPVAKKVPVRGADGISVKGWKDDTNDPEYNRKKEVNKNRTSAYMFYWGTKRDPNLKWDVEMNPETENVPDTYDKVHQELVAARIGLGYINKLVERIMDISGVDKETLLQIRQKTFLAEEESELQSGL